MTALLDIRGLRGGYGRTEVLRGVDLQVNAGEMVALLGSNGAGKSTLNKTVCGLCAAWSGTVRFNGQDIGGAHYREVVKAGLIQVPEGRKVFPNLSVLENLELGAFTRARERRAQNLEKVFATFPRLAEGRGQGAGTRGAVSVRPCHGDVAATMAFCRACCVLRSWNALRVSTPTLTVVRARMS